MVDENITPDFIIDKIMIAVAKGHKPKAVVLCQELHDLFMYDKNYKLPPLTARPEFFGLPCSIEPIDDFRIVI